MAIEGAESTLHGAGIGLYRESQESPSRQHCDALVVVVVVGLSLVVFALTSAAGHE
jgi:hypothetical protein